MKILFPPILFNSGKVLLLGSGSVSLALALYRKEGFERPFIRFAGATLLFFLFSNILNGLFSLSDELTHFFEQLGNRNGLKELISDALKRAVSSPSPDGSASRLNIPGTIEQIWRTGAWGVVSVLAECFFLLSSLLLEIGREITYQMICILYPLLIGVAPTFPGVTAQFLIHVLCVALWWPLFTLITVVTSIIARHYMAHTNSWGLAILALEVMACMMTCAVPMIAHKLVSGAISQTGQQLSVTNFQDSLTNRVESFGGHSE
mgnify:CR=1 FL=1